MVAAAAMGTATTRGQPYRTLDFTPAAVAAVAAVVTLDRLPGMGSAVTEEPPQVATLLMAVAAVATLVAQAGMRRHSLTARQVATGSAIAAAALVELGLLTVGSVTLDTSF